MAGGFGEADVARDEGSEDFCVEVFVDFVHDLVAEGGARVDHGREDAEEFEGRIHGFFDELHTFEKLTDALECVEFGLDGHDDVVGGDEAVDSEEAEAGGVVDNDEVVIVADGIEGEF